MSAFTCTYEELKQKAKEFLLAIPTLDQAGLDNGLKCFDLHYLECTFDHPAERIMVIGLVAFVHKKYFERDIDLFLKEGE